MKWKKKKLWWWKMLLKVEKHICALFELLKLNGMLKAASWQQSSLDGLMSTHENMFFN